MEELEGGVDEALCWINADEELALGAKDADEEFGVTSPFWPPTVPM